MKNKTKELSTEVINRIEFEATEEANEFIGDIQKKKKKKDVLQNDCKDFMEREDEECQEFLDFLHTSACKKLLDLK